MNEGAAVFNVSFFRIVLKSNKLYPPTCDLYYEKQEFTHQRTQTFLIATGLLLHST